MNKIENKFLLLLFREKKIIATGIITGLLLFIGYYLFFYVALFTTSCKIFVKNIQKQDIVASYNSEGTVGSESGYSNPLFNLQEVLKSERVATIAYKKIKNKYPEDLALLNVNSPESFNDAYSKLVSSIVQPSTDILQVKLLWPNKKHAPIVLGILVDEFKLENLYIRKSFETEKRKFLDNQLTKITKKLETTREAIKNYKLSSKLTDLVYESSNLISARIDLQKQQKVLKSQIDYNQRKLTELSKELNIKDAETALRETGVGSDPYMIKLSQDLAIAQQNYAKLKAKYTVKYPEVIAEKNEINTLNQNIKKRQHETAQKYKITRGIYDSPSAQIVTNFAVTQSETASLKEQYKALSTGIGQLLAEEAKLPGKQLGLDELKKQEDAYASAYGSIKEKQLEAKIKESEILDNLFIINRPIKASGLATFILTRLLGFLFIGLLGGTGFAYLMDGFRNRWSDLSEIKLLTGQNIIGSIPWLKDTESENARSIFDAALSNIAIDIASKAYLNNAFILSFVSTSMSKNKSFITEVIGSKILKSGHSAILIDLVSIDNKAFDLIDAINVVNKYIRFNGEQGNSAANLEKNITPLISQAIKTKIIEHNSGEFEFSSMQVTKDNIELNDYIGTKGFSQILEVLKQRYEFVLINAPHGLILLPEIQTIKKISDAVVLISTMTTNKDTLLKYVNDMINSGTKILGIIAREENSELEKSLVLQDEMDSVK